MKHYFAHIAVAAAIAGGSLAWAGGPSNAQYSIPASARNSGVGDMSSPQLYLSSSLGDGFGAFAMTGAGHTLTPGLWGAILKFTPPLATIAVSPAMVVDNGSALTFTVTLNPAPTVATPVAIASATVVGGTMSGVTNNCLTPVLVGPSGSGTCTISATNALPFDGPAQATVTLAAGAGWVLGTPSSAVGTIIDDDGVVGVTAVLPSIIEGDIALFSLTCKGAPSATVSYSYSGSYAPLPPNGGPVIITCGTPLIVGIPTINELAITGPKTLTLTLADPSPFALEQGGGFATVVIKDVPIVPTIGGLGLMLLGLLMAMAAVASASRRRR
jgi:hypothetical protein